MIKLNVNPVPSPPLRYCDLKPFECFRFEVGGDLHVGNIRIKVDARSYFKPAYTAVTGPLPLSDTKYSDDSEVEILDATLTVSLKEGTTS